MIYAQLVEKEIVILHFSFIDLLFLYILHDKHAIHGISGKTIDRILFSVN